MELIMA
jgi:hypothetical protein